MSYLKTAVKQAHQGIPWRVLGIFPDGDKLWNPWLGLYIRPEKEALLCETFDQTFDKAYKEFEVEMERINNLPSKDKEKALSERKKKMHCMSCSNKVLYEGWACRYEYEEFPDKAHLCFAYNKDI